jgi:hypothetical protein
MVYKTPRPVREPQKCKGMKEETEGTSEVLTLIKELTVGVVRCWVRSG